MQLASSLQSYRLSKRYSDFVTLDAALRSGTTATLAVSLPPKTYLTRPDVEQRRAKLEVYLRHLCTTATWCDHPEVGRFLQLPEGAARAREEQDERGDFYGGVRNVKRELQVARRWLVSPPTSGSDGQHASVVEAKRHIAAADKLLERVQRHAREPVSKQEARRRADIVDELGREVMALVDLASSKRANPTSATTDAAVATTDNVRGRVLGGPARETPETLQLSNEGLLQQQKDQIHQQDKLLDDLLPILRRQRELGETIAREVDEHVELIDEIERGVDGVDRKMRRGKKGMDKLR